MDRVTGEQHQYYKTAKRIFEYAKRVKDESKEHFPLMGICQGFELLAFLANGDDKNTLSDIYHVENRKVDWHVANVRQESRLFNSFDQDLLDKMASEKYALHLHEWSIYYETYEQSDSFK